MTVSSEQSAISSNGLREKRATRRVVVFICKLLTVFLPCVSVEAQQSGKIPHIGFLEGASISESQGIQPFRQGLRELGYIDGQNIIVEILAVEGKPDRSADAIVEFLRKKVDVIFSAFGAGAQAAKKLTATIPIVFVTPDPVGTGLVASLARPGGNVTGLSSLAEVAGKRLEILKDTLPK